MWLRKNNQTYYQDKHIKEHIWKPILCHSAFLSNTILSAAHANYDKWIPSVLYEASEVATSGAARHFCTLLISIQSFAGVFFIWATSSNCFQSCKWW